MHIQAALCYAFIRLISNSVADGKKWHQSSFKNLHLSHILGKAVLNNNNNSSILTVRNFNM